MKVNLATYPLFLRTSFVKTRLFLSGNKPSLKKKSFFIRTASSFLLTTTILSLLVAGLLMLPDVYYRIFPADIQPIIALDKGTLWGGSFGNGAGAEAEIVEEKIALPPQNENLPEGDWLIIPRIGVRTELRSTKNPVEALKKGVWMSPEYGKPGGEYKLPIILAAHKFGWEWWWQSDYWKYNSFYNLPDLEPGDVVEIIADKRKWTYEIYAGEQGEEITDYEANLILYTCKFLNSPLRHFRYARLIDLNHNTQEKVDF